MGAIAQRGRSLVSTVTLLHFRTRSSDIAQGRRDALFRCRPTVCGILQNIGRKSPIFNRPNVFDAPIGMTPLKFYHMLWSQKARAPSLQ